MMNIIRKMLVSTVLFASIALSQDYTSFLTPIGFRLPPLRSGQYVIILQPSYSYSKTASTSFDRVRYFDGFPIVTPGSSASVRSPLYGIGSAAYYGLSRETTLSAAIDITPKQKLSSTTTTAGGTSNSYENWGQTYSTCLTLAHRALSNLELSLFLSYRNDKPTAEGYSSNSNTYNVVFNVVLLGN